VTGRAWRRIALAALVLVHMDLAGQIIDWIPGEWGVAVAFVVTAFFMVFWLLVPLRERPRCGFQLPVVLTMSGSPGHRHHHCADELWHASTSHKCRCGLTYTPIETTRHWPDTARSTLDGESR
jgi:hypothetical protein